MQLRRVGTIEPNLNVLPQIGKNQGSPGAGGQGQLAPPPPPVLIPMNRIMLTFEETSGTLTIDDVDPNNSTIGEWDIQTNYVVIPATGWYDIFFQATTDGANLTSMDVIITDSAGVELWRRTKSGHDRAHNLIVEEALFAGYRVYFSAIVSGSADIMNNSQFTFANIAQKSTYG
jgi:hypothetical protein